MIDAVIERFDVKLHDPVGTVIDALTQLLTGLVSTALRSESVRTVSEVGFEDWLNHRFRGCLDQAISKISSNTSFPGRGAVDGRTAMAAAADTRSAGARSGRRRSRYGPGAALVEVARS